MITTALANVYYVTYILFPFCGDNETSSFLNKRNTRTFLCTRGNERADGGTEDAVFQRG